MKPPNNLTVLALDLATTTGFAVLAAGVVSSGSVSFARQKGRKHVPDEHEGVAYIRFQKWLREALALYKPTVVVFEEPMGNFKNAAARNIIVGFRGIMMSTVAYYNLTAWGYPQGRVKMFWTGKGNAKKPEMVAETKRRFPDLELTTDDEADALAVLHLHLHENLPSLRSRSSR